MEPVLSGQKDSRRSETQDAPKQLSDWLRPNRLKVLLIVLAIVVAIVLAVLQGGSIDWLFEVKAVREGPLGELAVILAPLLGLALAIERIVETVFGIFERSTAEVAKLGSAGTEGLQWIQTELEREWAAARELAEQFKKAKCEESKTVLAKLKQAQQRIENAQSRIASLARDPKYVAFKRTSTIWLSLLLGLIVAIISDTGMCELLQVRVPRIVDMVLTGFIIGSGSGPMHSLVGILQNAKDALGSLGDLYGLGRLKQQGTDVQDKAG